MATEYSLEWAEQSGKWILVFTCKLRFRYSRKQANCCKQSEKFWFPARRVREHQILDRTWAVESSKGRVHFFAGVFDALKGNILIRAAVFPLRVSSHVVFQTWCKKQSSKKCPVTSVEKVVDTSLLLEMSFLLGEIFCIIRDEDQFEAPEFSNIFERGISYV